MGAKSNIESAKSATQKADVKTSRRTIRYFFVGVGITLFNYVVYALFSNVIIQNNDLLWLSSLLATAITTVVAYILHSKITWRERKVTKVAIYKFFIWNAFLTFAISPALTQLFSLVTPLYEFAFNISTAIHLPFTYEFVLTTGAFVLTSAVIMVLNFLFYDKFVFGKATIKHLLRRLIPFQLPPHASKKNILVATVLYALPVLFFVISYFLITTSGEDIWQGAGNFRTGLVISPLEDAKNAFLFDSRITDMYAWTVIDFFDYQFCFGPDLIFRLIDVAMAIATFYCATYLALGYRPKLIIKDALVFCACFVAVIITPFGRPFYSEFSMIHNYTPLALAMLLFSIPYLKLFSTPPTIKHPALFATGLLLLGVFFGMSAAITPLAFLLAVVIICIVRHKTLKRPPLWFFAGLLGIAIGFSICWFVGSGVSHYTNPVTAATFDYIAPAEIFNSPATALPRLLWHEVYNFGITFLPLLAIAVIGLIFDPYRRQFFTRKFYRTLPTSFKYFSLALAVFFVIHLLGASLVKAPPRLIMPAYFAGVIFVFRFFVPRLNSKLLGAGIIILTVLILGLHTTFLGIYHHTTAKVFSEIKASESSAVCIDASRINPPRIPAISLSQAGMLVDWGSPQFIYNKEVTFCK